MILKIFEWLSGSLHTSPILALLASFIWGILSIILSPCHLSSIPLIIGFMGGQGKIPVRKAFFISMVFAAGILVTISVIGIITGLMGRMLGDVGKYGNYAVAVIFFIVGLYLLDIIQLPWSGPDGIRFKKKGMFGALLLGLVFGAAVGPCTFAYMAPMLGVAFKAAVTNFAYSVSLLIAYGIGHCSVIVFAGTSAEMVQHILNWNEKSKGTIILKKICGIFVIMGGIYLLIPK